MENVFQSFILNRDYSRISYLFQTQYDLIHGIIQFVVNNKSGDMGRWSYYSLKAMFHAKYPRNKCDLLSRYEILSFSAEERIKISRMYNLHQGVWMIPVRNDAIKPILRFDTKDIIYVLLQDVFEGKIDAGLKIRYEESGNFRVGVICPDAGNKSNCIHVASQILVSLKPFAFSTVPSFEENDILLQRKEFPCKLEMDLYLAKHLGSKKPVKPLFDTSHIGQRSIRDFFVRG